MFDTSGEELGPIDYLVVVFPARTTSLAGAMATELASLVDAELIRVLDLVVVEKAADGSCDVREFEDLLEDEALGDLRALDGQLAEVLALEDLECVVAAIDAGTTAAIVVLENSWASPLAAAARASGGQVAADGRIPVQQLVVALGSSSRVVDGATEEPFAAGRPGRIGRPGVIAPPVRLAVPVPGATTAVIQGVERRGRRRRSAG